jgi:predicted SAM-dependent methyltransferase
MILPKVHPGQTILELGSGANPIIPNAPGVRVVRVDVRPCQDAAGNALVDFTADFEQPLPIASEEFDAVFSHFVAEHVSWRSIKQFIAEQFRVTKPGGKVIAIVSNTKAQMERLLTLPVEEWFEEVPRMLFGDLDYPENSHKMAFSPESAILLFKQTGFSEVKITPYGELKTDMVIEAIKSQENPILTGEIKFKQEGNEVIGTIHEDPQLVAKITLVNERDKIAQKIEAQMSKQVTEQPKVEHPNNASLTSEQRAKLFDKRYFNGGCYRPFYWDFPWHETTFRHVMARQPESVIELGCGRGYVLKKIEDAGVECLGVDISKHAYLTRVTERVHPYDLLGPHSPNVLQPRDLCLSMAFLECVPEELLPDLFKRMSSYSKRGIHGINLTESDGDKTQCTIRDRKWWQERLPKGHEVFDVGELESGMPSEDYLRGDGKIKVNIGCAMSQFMQGWINLDSLDYNQFAQEWRYRFLQHDVRDGLPFATGTVDIIFTSHFLEHLDYREGLAFLRDCRRVLKPKGVMRIVVPDAGLLMDNYSDKAYFESYFDDLDQINDGCENALTYAGKVLAILWEGHKSIYDKWTLSEQLESAGFIPVRTSFREVDQDSPFYKPFKLLSMESLDMLSPISLFVNAIPKVA